MPYRDQERIDTTPNTLFHHTKIVITRKPHPCLLCTNIIPKGSKASKEYFMTTDDAAPQGGYKCLPAFWGNSLNCLFSTKTSLPQS